MTERKDNFWLEADWPAPNNIKAGTSTRISGYSRDPYNESNLTFNVGDNPNDVEKNRAALLDYLILQDSMGEKFFRLIKYLMILKPTGVIRQEKIEFVLLQQQTVFQFYFATKKEQK